MSNVKIGYVQYKNWLTMFSHLVFNTRFDRFDFTHMFKFKKKKRSSFLKLESMLLVDAYYVKRKC
jgi:hypothetical protein